MFPPNPFRSWLIFRYVCRIVAVLLILGIGWMTLQTYRNLLGEPNRIPPALPQQDWLTGLVDLPPGSWAVPQPGSPWQPGHEADRDPLLFSPDVRVLALRRNQEGDVSAWFVQAELAAEEMEAFWKQREWAILKPVSRNEPTHLRRPGREVYAFPYPAPSDKGSYLLLTNVRPRREGGSP